MDMLEQNPVRIVAEAGREVLGRPVYLLLAIAIAVLVLAATLWLPNYRLLGAVFSTPGVALVVKLQLLASLVGGLASNFDTVAAVTTVIIPVLFGLDVAMLVYFAKQRRTRLARGEVAAGLGGAELGLLSIALLLLSIYLIARKIAMPPVCVLPPGGPFAPTAHQPPTRNTP